MGGAGGDRVAMGGRGGEGRCGGGGGREREMGGGGGDEKDGVGEGGVGEEWGKHGAGRSRMGRQRDWVGKRKGRIVVLDLNVLSTMQGHLGTGEGR